MKTNRFTIPALTLGLLCLGSLPLPSTLHAAEKAAQTEKIAPSDEMFMKAAAQDGMMEVKLGELAKEKASNAEVKELGAMMAGNHAKANEQLKSIAAKNGVTLPNQLDNKQQEKLAKLSKLSGAEFDKAYVHEMLQEHKKDAAEFEQASKGARNPEVKAFAEATLPVIKTHLDKVASLSRSVSEKGPAAKGEKKDAE